MATKTEPFPTPTTCVSVCVKAHCAGPELQMPSPGLTARGGVATALESAGPTCLNNSLGMACHGLVPAIPNLTPQLALQYAPPDLPSGHSIFYAALIPMWCTIRRATGSAKAALWACRPLGSSTQPPASSSSAQLGTQPGRTKGSCTCAASRPSCTMSWGSAGWTHSAFTCPRRPLRVTTEVIHRPGQGGCCGSDLLWQDMLTLGSETTMT